MAFGSDLTSSFEGFSNDARLLNFPKFYKLKNYNFYLFVCFVRTQVCYMDCYMAVLAKKSFLVTN